jgi:hypothetical protein
MNKNILEHVRDGMIIVIMRKRIALHQATVTQLVDSCQPVERAGLGQEVLCQTTGPSGSCSLLIRRKSTAANHYNLISKQQTPGAGELLCRAAARRP